jgi:hypothetical protein
MFALDVTMHQQYQRTMLRPEGYALKKEIFFFFG